MTTTSGGRRSQAGLPAIVDPLPHEGGGGWRRSQESPQRCLDLWNEASDQPRRCSARGGHGDEAARFGIMRTFVARRCECRGRRPPGMDSPICPLVSMPWVFSERGPLAAWVVDHASAARHRKERAPHGRVSRVGQITEAGRKWYPLISIDEYAWAGGEDGLLISEGARWPVPQPDRRRNGRAGSVPVCCLSDPE